MLMNLERRHKKLKPVIKKALVDVEEGDVFDYFEKNRSTRAIEDCYCCQGSIQYFGPAEVTDNIPLTTPS